MTEQADTREAQMVVVERDDSGKPTVWCDPEVAPLVAALNGAGFRTVASCSGHGKRPASIVLSDGREIIIAKDFDEARKIDGLFPGINGEPATIAAPAPVERVEPKTGVLVGEPEIVGERCADGGTCHHGCTDECWRKTGCGPLTCSGLNDDWSSPPAGFAVYRCPHCAASMQIAAPQPAPTACTGKNCGSTDPNLHSAECFAEHEQAIAPTAAPPVPKVTSAMKAEFIGEFFWDEEAPYYDEDGELHDHVAQRVVPWDLCKRIYKEMAGFALANGTLTATAAQDVAGLVTALRTVVGMLHHKATTPLERESIKIAEAAIAAHQSGGAK